MDDVLGISGHRLGTAEVESALVAHPNCRSHRDGSFHTILKVEAIYALPVTLNHEEHHRERAQKSAAGCVKRLARAGDAGRAALDRLLPETRQQNYAPIFCAKIAAGDTPGRAADPGVVKALKTAIAGCHR